MPGEYPYNEELLARILAFVEKREKATCFTIETGLDVSHVTVSPSVRELVRRGKLRYNGERVPNQRGNSVRVYVRCDLPENRANVRAAINPHPCGRSQLTLNRIAHTIARLGNATYDEVVEQTGMLPQTVSAAIGEMIRLDRLEDTGIKRKTRLNRNARVVRVKPNPADAQAVAA